MSYTEIILYILSALVGLVILAGGATIVGLIKPHPFKKEEIQEVPERLGWVALQVVKITKMLPDKKLRIKAIKFAEKMLMEGADGTDTDD